MVKAKAVDGVQKYELMVILKPLLPDNVRKDVQKSIADLIKKHGGEIVEKEVWGKKYLSYPIQGQKEGYYIVYQITHSPKKLPEIKPELDSNGEVMRYLFLTK